VSVSKHQAWHEQQVSSAKEKGEEKKTRFQTHHLLSFPNLANLCEVWREQMSAFLEIISSLYSLRGNFQRLLYS
jgi:hypothetical protein